MVLDPRTHAVRGDLADVRLADRVFAPHYAAPVPAVLRAAADLRGGAEADAEVLGHLAPGSGFEVLEVAGGLAWGIAPERPLVGYLPEDVLGFPE